MAEGKPSAQEIQSSGRGNMIIGRGIIWTSFNPGALACNTMYVRPMSTPINQDVLSTKVTIHQPRCTFDLHLHPSTKMYLRPRSTSIGRDVPLTEVDIFQPGCTLFDEQQIPPRQKTVLRSLKTIQSTEDYKELGRDKEGPLTLK